MKVGDKVRCIDSSNQSFLQLNQIYTIKSLYLNIFLISLVEDVACLVWSGTRFEVVVDTVKEIDYFSITRGLS